MDYSDLIIDMYNKGYSINCIVNEVFRRSNYGNKIYNNYANRIIVLRPYVKKEDVRGRVYSVIYDYKKYCLSNLHK